MITEEQIRKSAEEVFTVMKGRCTSSEMKRIRDAFEMAFEAHSRQQRKTGEPYIIHPIAVARIVAEELELGASAVIAAFLHDVVEDTPHTIEEIRERFGEDVAFLVDVVTKRKKTQDGQSKQVENFRQIMDSVHYDIRALMVKLADRLHNMRTLSSMKPDKQMKIAGETDFFYAPLANRLGLYHVKSELENLSFKYRCGQEYETIEKQLEGDRLRTDDAVRAFTEEIDEILKNRGINARIQVRYRKPYSIWRDMKKESVDFSHVEFKHYVRVIYTPSEGWSEKDTSLFIYSVLTDKFKERPGSVVNYIDAPKENGYQSFHVKLLGRPGCWEELHISSERMLRNSRLGCIVKTNEESMRQWLGKLQNLLKDMAEHRDTEGFMEGLTRSLYNEDIYVLTPKGMVVLLPQGATALDFAFELHTDIGEHAQYARVNGRLCSVKTELHRGDCVEIGTNEEVHPQREWLDYVKSTKAKNYLLSCTRHDEGEKFLLCPICHPLPGDEVVGFQNSLGRITLHRRHCPEAIRLASEEGDAIVSANFDVDLSKLFVVRLNIVAIDRYHLLHDIIDCIVEQQRLSMVNLNTVMSDQIVNCTVDFGVHSAEELSRTIASISLITGVDEVKRVEIEN
ncbi:MAG: HD domain-containing protein [Bacteroidaceae bacterium]|nr:HD domain-containing protein [Bacteroidaceae bacterium]